MFQTRECSRRFKLVGAVKPSESVRETYIASFVGMRRVRRICHVGEFGYDRERISYWGPRTL
jgi:hypothetical protein